MVDKPGEGRNWAVFFAARRGLKGPGPAPGFRRLGDQQPPAHPFHGLPTRPEAGREKVVSHDHPHEGGAEWTELGTWLKKLVGVDDNRDFDGRERDEITREIGELRAEIRALTEQNIKQREALERSLEKLLSGSERMGRKDWFTYGIGLATSLVIAEIVPPLVLLPLAVHFIHALGHLLIPDV